MDVISSRVWYSVHIIFDDEMCLKIPARTFFLIIKEIFVVVIIVFRPNWTWKRLETGCLHLLRVLLVLNCSVFFRAEKQILLSGQAQKMREQPSGTR